MEIIFTEIFNMSVTASILIIAVILLRLILKNAPKWTRYILWLLVALRLVIPFTFESRFSLVPNAQAINSTSNSSTSYVSSVVNSEGFQTMQSAVSLPDEVSIITILTYFWIIGVTAMLIYMLFSYLHLHFKLRESVEIKDNILICDRISSPFVFGIIRPRIYLPSALSDEEKTYVIAHEQAHIKHYDNILKPFGYLILSIHFFNSLCWIAFRLFTKDIELACDERVIKNYDIQDKKGYSTALLSCSIERNFLSACPFSFGESGLKQRIKSVLSYKKPTVRIVILSFAVCILTAMSFMTNPITSALEIHSVNRDSAIDNLKKLSFDFAEPPTTAPVTEPTTNPTEPQKPDKKAEEILVQETVSESEPSEEYAENNNAEDYYNDYSNESYQDNINNNSYVPITDFSKYSIPDLPDEVLFPYGKSETTDDMDGIGEEIDSGSNTTDYSINNGQTRWDIN